MRSVGLDVAGTSDELLDQADVVVDCTPKQVAAKNIDGYRRRGVKFIVQGGEEVLDAFRGSPRIALIQSEYAEVLRAVDVEDTPVKAFAEGAGLTTSNAGVRLFRAREALRKQVSASCSTCAEHGCVDCSCGKP